MLEFQRRFQDQLRTNNLNSTFGVAQIPADSEFRDLLDSYDYEPLLGCFGDWIGRMQYTKWLQGVPAAAEHRPRRPIAAPRQPAASADRR